MYLKYEKVDRYSLFEKIFSIKNKLIVDRKNKLLTILGMKFIIKNKGATKTLVTVEREGERVIFLQDNMIKLRKVA